MKIPFAILLFSIFAPATVMAQGNGFGRRQVKQMLADRPDMKSVIDLDHPIYQWVVAGFEGSLLGQRIYWNANSPTTGRPAEHAAAYGHYPPFISISGGSETTPVDKWAAVVFELCNLKNDDKFAQLAKEAAAGKLSADEYATECVMLEYDAQLLTQKVFQDHPLPDSSHGKDDWYNAWVKPDLPTAEVFRKEHAVPGSPRCNYDFFRTTYQSHIAPHIPPQPTESP
ncbi:hypothetical protein LOC71_22735 [Rhodopirellula sp. JC740]|uniref:Uncharacterized protein n=1 Tax=Rhodopirellula halodulae TaxID=2894198 RepID=A0ABS8NNM9_9BACT|nr:hypothetical protein [Rhodopirellula sp. JC740]MCC9645105.1 hypothetical protein [Rhodopirellula sp. JC740]